MGELHMTERRADTDVAMDCDTDESPDSAMTDTAMTAGPGGWIDQVTGVASREYRPAIRSRWPLGIALLFAGFTTALVQFGASSVGPGRFDAIVASIAELGVYLIPLLALAFGYDAVIGAEDRGSLELVLALPISKRRVVLGKYLGRAVALAGAMLIGFLPGAVLTLAYVGVQGIGTYAFVALSAALTGLAFLSIAVFVSTIASEKAHAMGFALAAWLWFALLHDLTALAAIAALNLPENSIAAIILANPTDCYRVLVLSTVDVTAGGFGAILQQANISVPMVAVALLAWIVVPLSAAGLLIDRRRL